MRQSAASAANDLPLLSTMPISLPMTRPDLATIRDFVLALGPDVQSDVIAPVFWFYRGSGRRLPFASLSAGPGTGAGALSGSASLGPDDVRVALDLGPRCFGLMFPDLALADAPPGACAGADAGAVVAPHDTVLPLAGAGRPGQVTVINPQARWPQLQELLAFAYVVALALPS